MLVGRRSREVIKSVEPLLGDVVERALLAAPEYLDFAATSGLRTAEEQHRLWLMGRQCIDGVWTLVDPKLWRTDRDGYHTKSEHQLDDNGKVKAIDLAAYRDGKALYGDAALIPVAYYVVGYAAAHGVTLGGGFRWGCDYGHLQLETGHD